MDKLQIGNWHYVNSCSTETENIWLVEMKNGNRQWFSRFDLKKFIFLDALPVECVPTNEVMADANVYRCSTAF